MPKVAKSLDEWKRQLKLVATGKQELGRGQAPHLNTDAGRLLDKIKKCVYYRMKRHCKIERKLFATEGLPCTCDYHKPGTKEMDNENRNEGGLEEANVPGLSQGVAIGSSNGRNDDAHHNDLPSPVSSGFCQFQTFRSEEVAGKIGWATATEGKLRTFLFAPKDGCCPECGEGITLRGTSKSKLCYSIPWPYAIQGMEVRCESPLCRKFCTTFQPRYIATLPWPIQARVQFLIRGHAYACDESIYIQMRESSVATVLRSCEAVIMKEYLRKKLTYEEKRCLGVRAAQHPFPEFPKTFIPTRVQLVSYLLFDYDLNKIPLQRELKSHHTKHGVAIDHQAQVAKRIAGKDVLGEGGQTLTVMGDYGLCLTVLCVPDTKMDHLDRAMLEVMERKVPAPMPEVLYVDCGCCNGKPGGRFGSAGANWKNKFERVVLDGMHLIMRLAREVNAEHPRRSKLLRDLASAIYEKCPEDMAKLKAARNKAGLPPDGTLGKDRYRFVKTLITGGKHTANRVKAVIWSHMKMDTEAKKDIPQDTPLSPADIEYPLISKNFCRCSKTN